jgi:hypothetical protein
MFSRPQRLTPLARYTQANGFLYLVIGFAIFAAPGVMEMLPSMGPFEGEEEGLVRVIGFAVAVIGWFYVFGARTNVDSFGLATAGDRLLVPFFLVPLGLTGQVDGLLVYTFSVVDPLLGLGALLLWRRQRVT